MKRIVYFVVGLTLLASNVALAQKHAPRIEQNRSHLPGIYPEASTRLLTFADVRGLTKWDLKIMRNEIYARYGYVFKTDDMNRYFNNQSWYHAQYENVDGFLNTYEKKNIAFIKKQE